MTDINDATAEAIVAAEAPQPVIHRFAMDADDVGRFNARLAAADPAAYATYDGEHAIVPPQFVDLAERLIAEGLGPDKNELRAFLADRAARYEAGGLVIDGKTFATDRDSRMKLFLAAQDDAPQSFKTRDGFVAMSAEALREANRRVAEHARKIFAIEALLAAKIDDGKARAFSEIEAAFDAAMKG